MLLLLFKVDVHESSARVTVFPLLAFHVCFLWTMSPKLRLWSSSRVSYFRFRFKDSFSSCFYEIYVCLPIFFPSFLIIKMCSLWFFLHLSISEAVNNIKIICSIRFSLFITIDRFYKLFLQRVLSWITDLRWSPRSFSSRQNPIRLASLATFPTRGRLCRGYCFSTHACIRSNDLGIAVFSYRSLPHWGRGTASAVDRVLS